MKFNNLKEKCEYYRGLTDYRLIPNSYVIAFLDGHCFSRLIKNKYKKPFDEKFMSFMDETAKYLCKNIQGAKLAYVQSDEISILITDFDTPETDAPFGYRICKLQSLLAGMASSKFNQLAIIDEISSRSYDTTLTDCEETLYKIGDCLDTMEKAKLAEFDCKVWSVPDYNTAFCWFLWRQNDCTRNSKQQTAQTYLPHKTLLNLNADEQIVKLKEETGVDWKNDFSDGEKYGRLIYKEAIEANRIVVDNETAGLDGRPTVNFGVQAYTRHVWESHYASPFIEEDNIIKTLIPQRND